MSQHRALQNFTCRKSYLSTHPGQVSKLLGYKDYADLRKENAKHPLVRPLGKDKFNKDRGSDFHLVVLDLLKRADSEGISRERTWPISLTLTQPLDTRLRMFLSSPSLIKAVF